MSAPSSGQPEPPNQSDVSDNVETVFVGDSSFSNEPTVGSAIDVYQLRQRIGAGGMGEVWLADQKEPVRRRVAIKLIKAGMDTREVVARFQSERQALALMDHPAIAKVFDAGSTPQGRPYFVMEYVPGIPITAYCDQHKLSPRARLELFIRVCEGVQHAHQKATIHRDLKPSNILVSDVDGTPMPRIIDFGIAKATSPSLAAEATYTRAGVIVGTPGYMSPEQADPNSLDIDTRTDVYSLGVVLYELLAGAPPLDFRQLSHDEILKRVRDEEPPRPSTKVRMLGEQSIHAAQNRGVDAPALRRQLRGDLDAIALKALEKDRTRRYDTPSELAGDIARYLRNEPVIARPASAEYRARKYIRRHRVSVALVGAAALIVISFAIMQSVQLRRITRERDRANRVTDFMKQMFKVSNPSEARGASVTAREILDKASKDVETGLARDPELQAQMMSTMGSVYESLGLYSRATPLQERSIEVNRRVLGVNHPETLRAQSEYGWTLQQQGRYAEAEKLFRDTLERQRRTLGAEARDTLKTLENLSWTLEQAGHYPESEKLGREALDAQRRVFGPDNSDTLKTAANLSWTLQQEGLYGEAEKLGREGLEIQRRVLGRDHPDTLAAMNNLAGTLMQEHNFTAAEALYREAVEESKRVLGPEHPDTLTPTSNLAIALMNQGRFPEAEALQRQTLAIRQRVLGPEHPETLKITDNLAESLQEQGHYTEAERLDRNVLDIQRRVLGPEHPTTLGSAYNLANTLVEENRYAEAEKLYLATLASQRRVLGENHPFTVNTVYSLGCLNALQGHRDEAFSLVRDALNRGLSSTQALAIESDKTLQSLHADPRFAELVAYARQRAATPTR
jgi:serine/threonine protein kinase